jgi:16S rRNA (cytosine1402-N4)-methyltransferase
VFGTKDVSPLNPISKKPIEPGSEEIKNNPRSRSARLRVAEKNK